jgi:hypothetical protein
MSEAGASSVGRLTRLAAEAAEAAAAAARAANTLQQPEPQGEAQPSGGAPAADGATQVLLQAFTAALRQQHLDAEAARAEAVAGRLAQVAAAELALAEQSRAAAGQAPQFSAKSIGMEAHRWLITMERWFGSARIAAGDDATRITEGTSALRDTAQTWWKAEQDSGRAAGVTTWAQFAAAIRRKFLPQDPERWAMGERARLTEEKMKDVARYTSQYSEWDMLLPNESELARVMAYEKGLPEEYRVKCAERRYATLVEATTAMVALWNARAIARGSPASLSHTEMTESDQQVDGARVTPATAAPPAQTSEDRIVERLMAMMTERFSNSQSSPGRGAWRGRDRKPRGTEPGAGGSGDQRPPRARTPGISDEMARARVRAGQCIKCGEKGHFARECTNPTNSTK